jgi:hypothetical protein
MEHNPPGPKPAVAYGTCGMRDDSIRDPFFLLIDRKECQFYNCGGLMWEKTGKEAPLMIAGGSRWDRELALRTVQREAGHAPVGNIASWMASYVPSKKQPAIFGLMRITTTT